MFSFSSISGLRQPPRATSAPSLRRELPETVAKGRARTKQTARVVSRAEASAAADDEKDELAGFDLIYHQLVLSVLADCDVTDDIRGRGFATTYSLKDGEWCAESPHFKTVFLTYYAGAELMLGPHEDEEHEEAWDTVYRCFRMAFKAHERVVAASSATSSPLGNLLLRFPPESRAGVGKAISGLLKCKIKDATDGTEDKPANADKKARFETLLCLWQGAVFGALCTEAGLDQALAMACKRGVDATSRQPADDASQPALKRPRV